MAALALGRADLPGVLNVCSGVPTVIATLADTIAALRGVAPTITHAPTRAGDIRASLGDPMLARRHLGLGLPTPLADGLARTLRALGA